MFNKSLIRHLNNTILSRAKDLNYIVKTDAPATEAALFNQPTLVVWQGASDATIFQDARVNWAFRALHDALHLKTRLGFNPLIEVELGRLQASMFDGIVADLVYCEVAGQAEYFLKNGIFVKDQIQFTKDYLTKQGIKC